MAIDTKIIHLDKNLEIIDGNREYYIYFERVGHRFSRIEEIVHPEQKEEFVKFLKETSNPDESTVLKFRKYTDEYKFNIVQAYDDEYHGETVKFVKLTDISDIFNFLSKASMETMKVRDALSLTGETFFAYNKLDNVFRFLRYQDGKCNVIFNQDIDSWKKAMIESKMIEDEQIPELDKFVSDLKNCPNRFYSSLKCGFRTSGKITECLDFIGVRHEFGEDISVNGRVMLSSKMKLDFKTNNLINQLQLDPLTNTYNKKTISEIAVKRIKEAKDKERIAFAIVDLDHFKPVNDAYGHLAGDKVLEESGEILLNIVGNKGTVGRYGGDEFFIILNNVENEMVLRGTLQAILEHIRNHFENAFADIKITTSIGAAVFPDNGTTYDELFKKADFCLYRAKDKGRNRYIFFRDDLHLDLYKKSISETVGVKYQGREIQELKYMAEFMQNLAVSPFNAIKEVLEHMLETYGLDNISIYYGEDMNRIYSVGKSLESHREASYARSSDFKKLLQKNGRFVRMDFQEDIKESEKIKKIIVERNILSSIQCILGTVDDVKGLVTFNKVGHAAQWAEYEVNCAVMFASSFNLLSEATKVDFALYSKLKN